MAPALRRQAEIRLLGGRYLATIAHLRPKTKANYESTLRCHLLPSLADIKLRRLDRPAVKAFFARLTDDGVAPARSSGSGR